MNRQTKLKLVMINLLIATLLAAGAWWLLPEENNDEDYRAGHELLIEDPEAAALFFDGKVRETGDLQALSGKAWGDWMLNRIEKAEAIALFIESREPKGWLRGSNLLLLGRIETERKEYEKALKRFTAAYAVFEKLPNPDPMFQSLLDLTFISIRLNDYKRAENFLDKAEVYLNKVDDLWQAHYHRHRAAICLVLAKYQEGLVNSERANAIFEKMGNKQGAAEALVDMGFFLIAMGQTEAGLHHTRQAAEVLEDDEIGMAYLKANYIFADMQRGRDYRATWDEVAAFAEAQDERPLLDLLNLLKRLNSGEAGL
ncbi:MAG: hypothetical protein QNK37_09900 [Acidobacteriota bacterium]|nr:hypothetical protein [Acidobacteriota bacterium]